MMKQIISLSALCLGLVLSSQANAAAVALAGSSQVKPTNCPALANNITVQLSSNVVAGFNCDASSFVAATCHAVGTNKPQSVDCVYVQDPAFADPNEDCADSSCQIPKTGYDGCPEVSTIPVDWATAGTWPKAEFQGRVAFGGGSSGGQVGVIPLGDLDCNGTNIVTLIPDEYLASGTSTSE